MLGLLRALARYQAHTHPRGSYSYKGDLSSIDHIEKLLAILHIGITEISPLLQTTTLTVSLESLGLIGDTTSSSAAYLAGFSLTGMDIYDTVVVILSFAGCTKMASPYVRIFSGTTPQAMVAKTKTDPEWAMRKFRSSKRSS